MTDEAPYFQTFSRRTDPSTAAPRVARLRDEMARLGIHAFLVPRADAHQGENVAPCDERLRWLTSFTGSAGTAIVSREAAILYVDGRYTLQARSEVDAGLFAFGALPDDRPADWLAATLPAGARIGFDPWLHTVEQHARLETQLKGKDRNLTLHPVDNPIDAIWTDRPDPPRAPIVPHDSALAGRSAADKRRSVAQDLTAAGAGATVLGLLDSIAWLLNIRGGDIDRLPVPRAFAIAHADGRVDIFTEPGRAAPDLSAHLGPAVALHPPAELGPALDQLTGPVMLDRAATPVWIAQRCEAAGHEIVWMRDPCIGPKARKTDAEIDGARRAHITDGAAMVRFLAWLDGAALGGDLTEIDVVHQLERFRRATGTLRDISFETICGAGPNGAVIHYRVTDDSNRPVTPGAPLLVDSGGQYPEATTDITRTIAIGPQEPRAVAACTRVLQGLIALTTLRWAAGRTGRDLDTIARAPLWRAGLDYDHGTGHGVGAYLDVHEGPQSISIRGNVALEPGMIVSIEPGFYREGAFGLRLENLAVVTPAATPEGGARPMLSFETLTSVPFDRRMIDRDLLDPWERAWLDAYHADVCARLTPHLSEADAAWLTRACAPI